MTSFAGTRARLARFALLPAVVSLALLFLWECKAPIGVGVPGHQVKSVVMAIYDAVRTEKAISDDKSLDMPLIEEWLFRDSRDSWRIRCLPYLESYSTGGGANGELTPRGYSTVHIGRRLGVTNIALVVDSDGALARIKCNDWTESSPIVVEIMDSAISWRSRDEVSVSEFVSLVESQAGTMREDIRLCGMRTRRFVIIGRLSDGVVQSVKERSVIEVE